MPQDTEYGWFCACGAFHPNEEAAAACSECGGDRAFIKASLTSILEEARRAAEQQQREINAVAGMQQPAAPAAPADPAAATAAAAQAAIAADEPEPEEEPTAQFDPSQATNAEMARVQRYAPNGRLFDDEEDEDDGGTRMFDTDEEAEDDYEEERPAKRRGRYADDEEESEDDIMAERIIRWAPPITAIVCALIVAVSLIYYFVIA